MPALNAPSPMTATALPGASESLFALRSRGLRKWTLSCALLERVVFALAPLGEAAEPHLPKRADAVAPPGHDLVRIGLVADVPDQLVAGRIEHVVQGDRQLDDAKPRARWPPVTETTEMTSWRSSSASCRGRSGRGPRMSAGYWTVSSNGVCGRSDIGSALIRNLPRCHPSP